MTPFTLANLVLLLLAIIAPACPAAAQQSDIVATIDGVPVLRSSVTIDRAFLEKMGGAAEDAHRLECQKFRSKVWDILYAREIAQRLVTLTDDEAKEFRRAAIAGRDFEAEADKMRQHARAMLDVYAAVQAGASIEEASARYLGGQTVLPQEWVMLKDNPRRSTEAYAQMARVTAGQLTPDLKHFQSTHYLHKKMDRLVDDEIRASDPLFGKALEAMNRGTAYPEFFSDYVTERRLAWWAKRWETTTISVIDTSLLGACSVAPDR